MKPDGMTLRDWFAGQALAGCLACPEDDGMPDSYAARAWDYADSMMRERERLLREEANDAEREAREWVASARLTIGENAWGGMYVRDGSGVLGCGHNLADAVAEARANMSAKLRQWLRSHSPRHVASAEAAGAPMATEPQPAPSTPMTVDDETWARNLGVSIHATAPRDGWIAECGHTHSMMGMGRTIAEAVRALRAKVEGGTQ